MYNQAKFGAVDVITGDYLAGECHSSPIAVLAIDRQKR